MNIQWASSLLCLSILALSVHFSHSAASLRHNANKIKPLSGLKRYQTERSPRKQDDSVDGQANEDDFICDGYDYEQCRKLTQLFTSLIDSGTPLLVTAQPLEEFFLKHNPLYDADVVVGRFNINATKYESQFKPGINGTQPFLIEYRRDKDDAHFFVMGIPNTPPHRFLSANKRGRRISNTPPGVSNLTNVGFTDDQINQLVTATRQCFDKGNNQTALSYCNVIDAMEAAIIYVLFQDPLICNGVYYQIFATIADHSEFAVAFSPRTDKFVSFYDETNGLLLCASTHFERKLPVREMHSKTTESPLRYQCDNGCVF